MARVPRSAFDGKEVELIFLGTSMQDCAAAEAVLMSAEIDYTVEVEEFEAGPFSSSQHGAAFYVLAGQAAYCKRRLQSEGLAFGLTDE